MFLHTCTQVVWRSCDLEQTWVWALLVVYAVCLYMYWNLLFAFQLADKPSGCNEWQNSWWGKDHSLFLSVAGGVCLHALICAASLLLHWFFVLKASLHTCTVVFSQKDITQVAITIILWLSGNPREPWGYTEPALRYLVDTLCPMCTKCFVQSCR